MECTLCHTMPILGPLQPIGGIEAGVRTNWHPMELKGKHSRILCNRCHAAGYRPPMDCATCHRFDTQAPMMSQGCSFCHRNPQEVKPVLKCAGCHVGMHGLHTKATHSEATCTECHKLHVWIITGRGSCLPCHNDKKDHYPTGGSCKNCHDFKGKAAN